MGRLSQAMNANRSRGTSAGTGGGLSSARVEIKGLEEVNKKLERLAFWSEKDFQNLLSINERVGEVYNNSLRANIKDFDRDIKVYERTGGGPGPKTGHKGNVRLKIKRGQLRRSIGIWQPDKERTKVLSGPRTNTIARRKTRKYSDGWFAHIVEGGDSFGIKKRTQNTGVFERSKKATQQRMVKLQTRLLRKEYERFMK